MDIHCLLPSLFNLHVPHSQPAIWLIRVVYWGRKWRRDDPDHHPEGSELLLLQLLSYKLSSSGKGAPRQPQRILSPLAETTLAPQSHQCRSPCGCGNSSPRLLVHCHERVKCQLAVTAFKSSGLLHCHLQKH